MINLTHVGTPLYMSNELLKGDKYTSKCDVWAIGFIFYELLHHYTPWTAQSEHNLVQNIEQQPLKMNKILGADTKDFLSKTLAIYEE